MSGGCFIHRYGPDRVRVGKWEYRQCQKCGLIQSRSSPRIHGPSYMKIKQPTPTAWMDEFYPDPKVFARMTKEIIRRCNAELADEIMAKVLGATTLGPSQDPTAPLQTPEYLPPMDSSTMLALCNIIERAKR